MSGASEPSPGLDEIRSENDFLRAALKETILNVGSVVECAERVLKRAESRLSALSRDDEG
jgi:hypothetical protein